ncbi:hypothetical protein OsJ_25824 [Oryza sativa Japonica Group]|uniref:Uncharacterized protein n=1 Tax=Oryza sativa subsp. japonica TaxID=39947 RepID=B9FYS0_ORYSJ|nr:hypothetical protein OsJ_25824 [Oryza sativa Japonica Group]
MFEDLVSKVLPALLGRYVSFQKDQLTINIWNQEIILVDVELILEAFDYLQLPFALKKGRIGKLSVRIPWKTLGWGAIIIAIEDWSSDSLDKRELDGKLAKLKAIELAKISRRITDNQTGQSLLSYILAKILDNIQVSIRNVHITYADNYKDQGNFMFGLEFSSLSIQTDPKKQSFAMSLMVMSRQDEVNKTVEISNVGIYCHHLDEQQGSCDTGGLTETNFSFSHELAHPRDAYLLNPFNVTIFVLANKAGKLDGAPRYNITVELTALILSIDEIQIQQILNLCDYFSICALRTKYGRYRPSQSSLSKRHKGWQRMWWHYAQRSVLADVRRELRKTSWNYLGQRLDCRRKYVNFYRMKLELLQKGQEALVKSTKDNFSSPGSPRIDDQSAGAGQGWLKWLSRGMLGAGGTADTSSFADVSDDIIKDIYEGTEFHPISSAENHLTKENHYSLFVRKIGMKLVDAMFTGLGVECKIWDDSTTILACLDSLEIINPLNENKVLLAEKCSTGDGLGTPVISVQVDCPKSNHSPEALTRVVVQEFSAIYEPVFIYNLMHIYDLFSSFQFQHDRVLSSLNRFDSFGARLLSKLKYTSANRKKLLWDLRIHHFVVRLPSRNCGTEELIMVFEAGDVSMQSKDTVRDASRTQERNSFLDYISKTLPSNFSDDLLIGVKLDDLYNHFEVSLTGFEVKVLMPDKHDISSTFVKLDASIVFGLCIFLDEPVLKQLEVSFIVPFANMYFCQTLYSAFINLCFYYAKETDLIRNNTSDDTKSEPKKLALNMFASLKLAKLSLRVDLEDHHEESSAITVCIGDVDIRYAIQELSDIWVIVKMVQITSNNLKEESYSCVLCLSGNCKTCVNLTGFPESSTSDACLKLHYRTLKYEDQMHHVYQLNLNDVDLHLIPSVFGQIRRFLKSLDAAYPDGTNVVLSELDLGSMKLGSANTKFPKFALSSFCGVDGTLFAGIPVDHFPFVRMDFISGHQASGGSSSKGKCNETSDLNCYCAQGPASNSLCKTKHSNCSSNSSQNSMNASLTVLDLSLVSVRVHFHESCGILATLSVPESIAALSLSDASSWDLLLSAKDIMLSSSWTSPNLYFVDGMEAVFAVTDELISIGKASKLYKGNALQFLEQRILNEESPGPNDSINITVSVSDLAIFFCHSKDKGLALEKIANANMKFDVSAVLVSEKPERIDMDIVSLALQSSDSHTLVSIMSDGSLSPVFIKFAKHDGRDEILMSVPSFEVWLYLVDWDIIINHFHSYARKEESSSPVVHSAALPCSSDSATPSFPETDCGSLDDSKLLVTCENIDCVVHVPIWQKTENCASNVMPGTYGSCTMQATSHHFADDIRSPESKDCKFITLMFNSKHFVVSLGDSRMNFRCDLDRMKIILEMIQGDKGTSVPFMHISKAKAAGYIHQPEGKPLHLSVDLQAEYMDVGFSHQIFSFCRSMELKFPVSSSSASSFYSVTFKVGLRKGSILLNDGRWGSHGPVIETLVKNLLVQFSQMSDRIEVSAFVDLLVNYNNIDKVMWEPFIEPSKFQLNVIRKCANHALDISPSTEVWLNSSNQLNLNISEPLIEAILRLGQMITNSLNPVSEGGLREDIGILRLSRDDVHTRRYAPYILANDTSLPFKFRVYRGAVNSDDIDSFSVVDENSVPAGYAVPIYVEEALDEFFFQHREARSSEHLIEKRMSAVSHYMISIEFDATSGSSKPMSMDLVGIYFFEVNFSSSKKPLSEESWEAFASNRKGSHESGLIVPVVLDVSLHNYSKLIRVYSTVKLYNATSMPLELRFDIPFGVSSKVLGPILPDKEFPLPVHLSEAGQIRWHPVGRTYLWSETHSLSSLLSHESRVGFMKSSVCYPSHPSNDPFRCCVSVEEYSIPTSSSTQKSQPNYGNPIPKASKQILARKHFIRKVRLSTPLLIKNYLPVCISLTIDNGGVANEVSLKEVSFASIFFVDPSNDLGITFHIQDYRSLAIKFPRVESFSTAAKSNGPKFSLTETITFYSNELNCPLNVTLEKAMDANSGARELYLSVPFLLYNCTDLLLTITESSCERNGSTLVIPSSFELDGQTRHLLGKNGLFLVSEDPPIQSFANKIPQLDFADGGSSYSNRTAANNTKDAPKECNKEAKAYMFAPSGHTPATELLVKLNASVPNSGTETTRRDWSSPFLLVPASGSMNATIPQSSSSGAFLVAATSIPVSTELFGRTRAIAFQPRYVICNACSNDLFYRQKGTRFSKHLSSGQHSFLHWSDTERELLVSIRFDGPGWQWSGSFFPDRLGDVQLKMRNSASGVSNMIRVEVQNADIDVHSNKFAGRNNSNTGTILILLSDDKTGFVPYRVDNFSMEKLRIYQQKCESIETIVYPYTSCQYAWDEPCYPHRLTVEVPGERSLGTYNLDILNDDIHVSLPLTSEFCVEKDFILLGPSQKRLKKAERKFCISVHAEGAIKVLSVIDSNCHNMDKRETNLLGSREPKDADQKQELELNFSDVFRIHLPFIGISLISSLSQELLFASARETRIVAMQSLDQQQITIEMQSMQIDNQFSDSPYPVMLSFEGSHKGKNMNFFKSRDTKVRSPNENSSPEPILRLAAAKWRSNDAPFVSYQCINMSIAPFHLELEERLVFSMIDFIRSVSTRIHLGQLDRSFDLGILDDATDIFGRYEKISKRISGKPQSSYMVEAQQDQLLPSVVPIGAPWQQIHLLARKQKKVYIELFELTPIKLTFSFTSTPWLNRNESSSDPSTSFNNSTAIQRGLMALIDVEGVPVHLGEIVVENLMASWQSIQDILVRHYSRQLLHEVYKVFGSAGVIGNPMGFARNVGFGLKDFVSASRRGILQSPVELLNGIAQGSKTLIGSTVYAVSSATSHFSKTAYKGLVAFTYDEQAASKMDERERQLSLHGEGVLNGFLEGLTGLLQSPIKGAEKHGLPGVISGIAMGTAGLVARPMASILEATGRTAQSIRNRSNPHESNRLRVRFPRPVARDRPLFPYSWEEAIGISLLFQADGGRLREETFVMCKTLREPGKFLVLTEKLLLLVSSPYLVDLGSPQFVGVPPDPQWAIETEMSLKSIVHLDRAQEVVNIVGSNGETSPRDKRGSIRNRGASSAFIPLFHFSVEMPNIEDAEGTLQILLALIEKGKARRWDKNIIHRSNIY